MYTITKWSLPRTYRSSTPTTLVFSMSQNCRLHKNPIDSKPAKLNFQDTMEVPIAKHKSHLVSHASGNRNKKNKGTASCSLWVFVEETRLYSPNQIHGTVRDKSICIYGTGIFEYNYHTESSKMWGYGYILWEWIWLNHKYIISWLPQHILWIKRLFFGLRLVSSTAPRPSKSK